MLTGTNESSLKISLHHLLTRQLLLARRRFPFLNLKANLLQVLVLLSFSNNQVNVSSFRLQDNLQTNDKRKEISHYVLCFHHGKGVLPDNC